MAHSWLQQAVSKLPNLEHAGLGTSAHRFDGLDAGRASVVYSPDGRWLAAGSGRHVLLWDRRQPAGAPPLELPQAAPSPTLAFSSDSNCWPRVAATIGAELAVGQPHCRSADRAGSHTFQDYWRDDFPRRGAYRCRRREQANDRVVGCRKIRQNSRPTLGCRRNKRRRHARCDKFACTAAWTRVVGAASPAGKIDLWDTGQAHSNRNALGEAGTNAVAFSPDGTRLVAGTLAGTVSLWDTRYPDHQPVPLDVPSLAGTPPATP